MDAGKVDLETVRKVSQRGGRAQFATSIPHDHRGDGARPVPATADLRPDGFETASAGPDSRRELLRQLRRSVDISLREMKPHAEREEYIEREQYVSSGVPAVDRLLPGGGLRRGMLVEWVGRNDEARMTNDEWKSTRSSFVPPLADHSGIAPCLTLPLLAAREACREGGMMVVVDVAGTFYPPAAVAWGIDLGRLLVVRPRSARDALWATVQSLRSPAVATVWAALDRIDDRAFRRLQLAAQSARAIGLLSRPASARGQPTWADVRLGVSREQGAGSRGQGKTVRLSAVRCLQVYVLRCRQGRAGGVACVEIDDAAHVVREVRVSHDAHPVPVVAELANSTVAARAERRA
jgi:hypothetical protein